MPEAEISYLLDDGRELVVSEQGHRVIDIRSATVHCQVSGEDIQISRKVFLRMQEGVEYEMSLGMTVHKAVFRRVGNELFGRKLETFPRLSDLYEF